VCDKLLVEVGVTGRVQKICSGCKALNYWELVDGEIKKHETRDRVKN